MDTLKKFKASSYAVSIIYIIVGLIMILNPNFVMDAVNYVIGILIIIYGIVYTITLYQKRNVEIYGKFDLLGGVLCISFGLFLIFNPDSLVALIPFCTGIILLMDAIGFIFNSIKLKKLDYKSWLVNFFAGLAFIAFAIVIIILVKEMTLLLLRFIGVFLIIDALLDFYTLLRFRKRVKKPEKYEVIEAQIEEK